MTLKDKIIQSKELTALEKRAVLTMIEVVKKSAKLERIICPECGTVINTSETEVQVSGRLCSTSQDC